MEIVTQGPKGGGVHYWLRSLVPNLIVFAVFREGILTRGEDRDAPKVVARDADGREEVLLRTGTMGQAARSATRFRAELDSIGEPAFRRRYGLHPAKNP